MRIRTIKPEFWRSDDVTALSREHRLLFVGLWSYVDDNGVGIDDYRQIAADLFALEDDQKEVRDYVREGLATLSRGLLIARYMIDNKRYLYITGWSKHQRIDRPGKPRFPQPPPDWVPPTSEDLPVAESIATPSREDRETPATGTGEQGNRGTAEKLSRTAAASRTPNPANDAAFAEFWDAYPRRKDKQEARKAFDAVMRKKVDPARLIAAAKAYAATEPDEQYVKYPATWLRAGSYDNEPDQPRQLRAVSGGYQPFRNPADHDVYDEPLLPAPTETR
ncbi:hypothetical protein [Pseudonocardia sp.]|uniref:hypothetical protein n=1 Tax=Pseudonocardia sp. TaxID=60912 RepID=UPI003D13E912